MFRELTKSDKILSEFQDVDGNVYQFVVNEKVDVFKFTGKASEKDFKKFIKTHPSLRTIAVKTGIDALDAYKRNKKITARFFAKTPLERRLYNQLSKDLMKSGNYKMIQKKHIYGGVMYELESRKYPS